MASWLGIGDGDWLTILCANAILFFLMFGFGIPEESFCYVIFIICFIVLNAFLVHLAVSGRRIRLASERREKWRKERKLIELEELAIKEKLHKEKVGIKQHLYSLTPYEFEHEVAIILTHEGYEAEVTSERNDFGIDILATKNDLSFVVQVKQYSEEACIEFEVSLA